jgi:hypothetical protein
MPVSSNVLNLAFSSAMTVVSSEEGLVITELEDIVVSEAFEHSAEELVLSRSRHFNQGGTNES